MTNQPDGGEQQWHRWFLQEWQGSVYGSIWEAETGPSGADRLVADGLTKTDRDRIVADHAAALRAEGFKAQRNTLIDTQNELQGRLEQTEAALRVAVEALEDIRDVYTGILATKRAAQALADPAIASLRGEPFFAEAEAVANYEEDIASLRASSKGKQP